MAGQETIRLSVLDETGSPLCVASGDGQALYERIARELDGGSRTVLSFRNVNTLTPAFLNAAIGQLYGRFGEDHLRTLFIVEEIVPDDRALLNRVIDTAKLYYKDKTAFTQAIGEVENDY